MQMGFGGSLLKLFIFIGLTVSWEGNAELPLQLEKVFPIAN
jgi:hypothetical protein